jgi:tetratricopeptide (TPR) repeat protein
VTAQVTCEACGAVYEVDQGKYGGRKIKCKACSGIILVPLGGGNGIEVADPAVDAQGPAAVGKVSDAVFNRNRIAGQRAAVSISVLRRAEATREEIRAGVLAAYGDEAKRLRKAEPHQRRIELIKQEAAHEEERAKVLREQLGKQAPSRSNQEQKGLLADAVKQGSSIVTRFMDLDPKLEEAFQMSVAVLGAPTRPLPAGTDFGMQVAGAAANVLLSMYGRGWLWGKEGTKAGEKAMEEAFKIKLETIKAAHGRLLHKKKEYADQLVACERAILELEEQRVSAADNGLTQARKLYSEGKLDQASQQALSVLKTCPIDRIGETLVMLSQVAFDSGNMADAARRMQEAICFNAVAPSNVDATFNDLWGKAEAGLPSADGRSV